MNVKGKIAIVTGGGVFGDVSGKVTVNVADGDVYAIVSGGSMISGDVNQSEINVSGGTAVMKDREGYRGVPKEWIQGWGQGLALAFLTAILDQRKD